MSRSKIQIDKLRKVLSQAKNQNSLLGLQSLIDDEEDWFDEPEFDCQDVNAWFVAIRELLESFPHQMRSEQARQRTNGTLPAKIHIERIYRCGEMQGTWSLDGVRHNVYLTVDAESAPAGCDCPASGGFEPCLHCYQFVTHALAQLQHNQPLRSRIAQGVLESGTPPRDAYSLDPSTLAIAELNRIAAEQSDLFSDVADEDDDLLPPLAENVPRRILWDFTESSGGYLSVRPLLQQKKKRGGGFTKGKKIRLDKLLTDRSLPLTDADLAVVAKIERAERYYYGDSSYQLDAIEAIEQLVGQDNVAWDSDPIAIREYPNYLAVGTSKDSHRVLFSNEDGSKIYSKVIASRESFLRIDLDADEILVGKATSQEAELIRSLCQLPPVALDRLEDLLEPLAKLQKQISILLPPSVAGPVSFVDARAAILLRSRADGRLDFGLRVRDAAGVLRRPLAGPMVVATEREGKKRQLARSVTRESGQIDRLLKRWRLSVDRENWFGTIDDFGDALRLIEDLQSPESGVEVLWDRTGEKPVSVLGNLSSSNVKVDITNKRNWFGVSGECTFGEHSMPLADLINGLPADDQGGVGDYIKLADGQWARISEGLRKRLKRLQDATHKDRNTLKLDATAAPAIRELVDSDVAVKASRAWEKCIKRLAKAEKLDPRVPKNLDADLRDYQVDGFKWLRKLAEWGVGGILADDMGLGKTLQTLAVLLDRSADGPALVIAPTSVGFNWQREAERFAPDLDVHLYRETERGEFLPTVGPRSLVVCSYGLALRDAEALAGVSWSTLVLDEAQAIKNSRSKTSKAIAGIDADWTVALTGTPVENHLGELWSLFHVVSPGVFGGWEQFRKRFAGPIEKEGSESARHALAERLQPFVLRRTKSEVLTELPPRTEMNLYVDLSPAERAEYEKVRLAAIGEIETLEALPDIKDQRFKILALMTRLRQIACHAGLVNKQWTDSSAKLDQLCETLDSLREEGHRALVFSQFTEHLALIRKALDERGFTYQYLDGSTPAKARQVAVDEFQTGTADVFLISLKAGGTGLNLTAADYVIHMDPWWNPAVEDQATDRAHRMGQDKPVMVYRIVARGTIEEEILALHESKRDLVAGVMAGTEAAAKLSNDDLIRMLRT
ncbi:RNA polymerase-associated protein RapA [Stieleria neptunia]|uniref:RNA polymerase-associated protein RapA n=1 Tax=Stieleria neptunia TaxID=2527979 RepID=A0A518I2N3_9BACT|nr:DEAD/DEAH box helicase [Stieleria neptunia]QDV47361.1 RNA polymerase-associated protein RapA [Stieleria neptunia]